MSYGEEGRGAEEDDGQIMRSFIAHLNSQPSRVTVSLACIQVRYLQTRPARPASKLELSDIALKKETAAMRQAPRYFLATHLATRVYAAYSVHFKDTPTVLTKIADCVRGRKA